MRLKAALVERGMWSQYLEVGIGPDAEVFTKAPPMAGVGVGAEVGLHPVSSWNIPEPEGVLAIAADGRIVRSEEHTSELQSLMRHSFAVSCLKKKILSSPFRQP